MREPVLYLRRVACLAQCTATPNHTIPSMPATSPQWNPPNPDSGMPYPFQSVPQFN